MSFGRKEKKEEGKKGGKKRRREGGKEEIREENERNKLSSCRRVMFNFNIILSRIFISEFYVIPLSWIRMGGT